MNKYLVSLGILAAVVGSAVFGEPVEAASLTTFLSPGSVWEYTFINPTADPNWNQTTGGWQTGPAPFSNVSSGDFAYKTLWPPDNVQGDDDLWVRTVVDLTTADLSTVLWQLGVDNAFKLYANGSLISSDGAGGFTSRWEYSGNFGSNLRQGSNVIALALDDYGGGTAFDMQVTGETRAIPTPALLPSLISMGVVAFRKRKEIVADTDT